MGMRRMFSQEIIDSDAFLDMPVSSQLLYFHLAMRADDDGFVSPKKIIRLIGASDDDLKVLLAKRFLLSFESGVVVIKHWLVHNLIRADLYKETLCKKEKSELGLNENGAYTELRSGVSELKKIEPPEWLKNRKGELRTANVPQTYRKRTANVPKSVPRIGKGREGKVSIVKDKTITNVIEAEPLENKVIVYGNENINWVLQEFEKIFGMPSQGSAAKDRFCAKHLLNNYTQEQIQYMMQYCTGSAYSPNVGSVEKLWYKRADIIAGIQKLKIQKTNQPRKTKSITL